MDMTVGEWFQQRSFHHQDFRALATSGSATQSLTTTLILPTRNEAGTIGPILDTVARLTERSAARC
jgi:hypothetical protein